MAKKRAQWLAVLVGGGTLVALFFGCVLCESADYRKYKQIQNGMSEEEVQAILGPGVPIEQSEVPRIVVAVNPKDAEAAREEGRRTGSPPTVRTYPTRSRPWVEGDRILRWKNPSTGELIDVAFRDGKVCDKHYHDPNYL